MIYNCLIRGAWGAFGCDGAWPQAYYDWIVNNNGGRLEKEDCAPYHAADRSCSDDDSCNYMGAHLTGFYNKWYTTEAEMKELVFQGPVATTVFVCITSLYYHICNFCQFGYWSSDTNTNNTPISDKRTFANIRSIDLPSKQGVPLKSLQSSNRKLLNTKHYETLLS